MWCWGSLRWAVVKLFTVGDFGRIEECGGHARGGLFYDTSKQQSPLVVRDGGLPADRAKQKRFARPEAERMMLRLGFFRRSFSCSPGARVARRTRPGRVLPHGAAGADAGGFRDSRSTSNPGRRRARARLSHSLLRRRAASSQPIGLRAGSASRADRASRATSFSLALDGEALPEARLFSIPRYGPATPDGRAALYPALLGDLSDGALELLRRASPTSSRWRSTGCRCRRSTRCPPPSTI